MDRVLVLDSRVRSATALIRNLGKNPDISVTAGGESGFLPGILSKYSDQKFIYSRVTDNPKRFMRELKDHLRTNEYTAVFPVSDPTSLVCSKYKDTIEEFGTIVGIEDWETFEMAYDKYQTFNLAKKVNVPYPETYSPKSLADVKEISSNIAYPAVIKPRSKSLWSDDDGIIMSKVTNNNYPESCSELLKQFSRIFSDPILSEYPPLIQEYVPGEIMDTVILADDGDIQALLQNQRVRTYPRSGGAYTLAETVQEPKMVEYVERLVDEIHWTGPAMFEFMKSDGEFYLMEINGRYWGSIGLSLDCGLDIPRMHHAQITNRSFKEKFDYPIGTQRRWLLPGDMLWLFESFVDGDIMNIQPFIQSFFTANHDLISVDDPLPAIGKLSHIVKLGLDVLSGDRTVYGEIS